MKSFYAYVQTYRGGALTDVKSRFAEAAFHDSTFPRHSTSFDELSTYVEMMAHADMTTNTFDELWKQYEAYSL